MRYVVVIEASWVDKKMEKVRIPIFNEVRLNVNGSQLSVTVMPVGYVRVFEYSDEINDTVVQQFLGYILEDVKRLLRKKLKYSLKGGVFQTLKLNIVYVKRSEVEK